MAMTREQQKAESDRIMAKMGPLVGEELETYKLLMKEPGNYRVPGDSRECGRCGAKFQDTLDGKGQVVVAALEKFSDHQARHNPSGDRWAEAHQRIVAGKEAAKTKSDT